MIITSIFVFVYFNQISTQTSPNLISDLVLKVHDYKLDDKTIETHPLTEGFIVLSDNHKKSLPTKSSIIKRISTSYNTSTTTCTTIVTTRIANHTKSSTVGHVGRRLLYEASYDTEIDAASKRISNDDDDSEVESFLKVDQDDLSRQLFTMEMSSYGSGDTTEVTSESTITSSQVIIINSTEPLTVPTSLQPETSEPITTESTSRGTETTTSTTTMAPITEPPKDLSNHTQVMLGLNCTNATETLEQILGILESDYNILRPTYNEDELECDNDTKKVNVSLNFFTDTDLNAINNLLSAIENATKNLTNDRYRVNRCNRNEIELIHNVTSCYLINVCNLCGIPPRGVCLPGTGTRCTCFENLNDRSRPYRGDRCYPIEPDKTVTGSPSRWTPVIVGVLAGLAGLFFAITCCLWTIAAWRHRRIPTKDDLRIRRLWHLPRAKDPTSGTNANSPPYLNNTISTLSSPYTESDYDGSNISDNTFFKDLDQKMGENLRATITRPNTRDMIASLPSDTMSTLSSYDPIDELDAIIDNEDVETTFHDSLNELYEDNEMLEIVNPNLKLPRPNVDSKPTGLFSFFQRF